MVWFYERSGQFTRCEARPSANGNGFELAITGPDGNERVETFADQDALYARQQQLESTLTTDGWTGPHGRII